MENAVTRKWEKEKQTHKARHMQNWDGATGNMQRVQATAGARAMVVSSYRNNKWISVGFDGFFFAHRRCRSCSNAFTFDYISVFLSASFVSTRRNFWFFFRIWFCVPAFSVALIDQEGKSKRKPKCGHDARHYTHTHTGWHRTADTMRKSGTYSYNVFASSVNWPAFVVWLFFVVVAAFDITHVCSALNTERSGLLAHSRFRRCMCTAIIAAITAEV